MIPRRAFAIVAALIGLALCAVVAVGFVGWAAVHTIGWLL